MKVERALQRMTGRTREQKIQRGRHSGDTRLRLLMTAERLVGTMGLGGVSARAVAEAAKFKNNSAVQYHFGSMDNLFEQLLRHRMGQMEPIRLSMIENHKDDLSEDLPARRALELICLPHMELRDASGQFPYASFLCQYLPMRFPGGFNWVMDRTESGPPAITDVIASLRSTLRNQPTEIFNRRLTNASLLFFNCLRSISCNSTTVVAEISQDDLIEDALIQAVGALTAR